MRSKFSEADDETWTMLYLRQSPRIPEMAHPLFQEGLNALGITQLCIPSFSQVNKRLGEITGWKAVPVEGLESGHDFYAELARKEFPVGHFIRDRADLGYTPAPDIFHDMFGHVPFFANPAYAKFCEAYGKLVLKYVSDPEKLKKLERFFWFSIEFGLIETSAGRRIFGAGLLSSYEESKYALSGEPVVHPFDVQKMIDQDYRVDIIQPVLFVLKDVQQLYASLPELEAKIS